MSVLQAATCFFVVVLLAKRLPVALIPEQFFITPVRYDMIDYRRRGDFFVFQALHAQRMALEIQFSCLAPPGIIPTGGSIAAQSVRRPRFSVLLAVYACLTEVRASGKPAGALR